MGRAAITIDYPKLQIIIDAVEAKDTFANITNLCHAVSKADVDMSCCKAGRKAKPIHYGQVYLAIKGQHVTVKTQKGKRGRAVGSTGTRRSRGEKFSANPEIAQFIVNARKDAPEKYQPLVEKAAAGSTSACVKLKCIQCFGYEGGHRSCEANGKTQPPCGLYPLNMLYWPSRKEVVEYDPMSRK